MKTNAFFYLTLLRNAPAWRQKARVDRWRRPSVVHRMHWSWGLYTHRQQWRSFGAMFRPGSQKRTAAPDPRGQDHRRDRADHVSHCLRRVSHLLLHSLQGLLLMLSPLTAIAGRFV